MIIQTAFSSDVNIGLYGFATDKYALIGNKAKDEKKLKEALKVPVIETTALDTNLVKIFIAGNSSGIIVPKILEEFELGYLKQKLNVLLLDDLHTALGNLILMNDKGIIISPLIRKHKKSIADHFSLPCEVSAIAKMSTVGALALATNKGCLVHPKIRKDEKQKISSVLGVELKEATVNFGTVHVGAGIIANSRGAAVGSSTSGFEIGAINECLKVA